VSRLSAKHADEFNDPRSLALNTGALKSKQLTVQRMKRSTDDCVYPEQIRNGGEEIILFFPPAESGSTIRPVDPEDGRWGY